MFADKEFVIPKSSYVVRKGDIESYFTEPIFLQIGMWKSWKRLGSNVFGGGWADWPGVFVDIIEAIEDENNKRMNSGNK